MPVPTSRAYQVLRSLARPPMSRACSRALSKVGLLEASQCLEPACGHGLIGPQVMYTFCIPLRCSGPQIQVYHFLSGGGRVYTRKDRLGELSLLLPLPGGGGVCLDRKKPQNPSGRAYYTYYHIYASTDLKSLPSPSFPCSTPHVPCMFESP